MLISRIFVCKLIFFFVPGRSHNSSGILWRFGSTATDPVKLFVETGKADLLVRERAEEKKGILSEFFAPPVTQGVGTTETKFFVDAFHSKVGIILIYFFIMCL